MKKGFVVIRGGGHHMSSWIGKTGLAFGPSSELLCGGN